MNNNEVKKNKRPLEQMSSTAKLIALIGSVLGALLLWIYAIGYDSTLFESTFDGITVVVEGEEELKESKGFTLAESYKEFSITVVAKGKRSQLNELKSTDFRAVIDVSLAEDAGEQTFNIVVYSPNGIEVVSQSSTTAKLFVDEFTRLSKPLAVKVDTGDGNAVMSEGVTFFTAVSNPLFVDVYGPKSMLDKIDAAYVKFDLDGHKIDNNISGYGAIELRDKNNKVINNPYITVSESTAHVEIRVTKEKIIPVTVVFTGGLGYDPVERAIPSVQSVKVTGSPTALDSINTLVLYIDESTVKNTAKFEFPVSSYLPEGVSRDESSPSVVTVNVNLPVENTAKNFKIKADDIVIEGIDEGMSYEVNNDVTVTVVGPKLVLSEVDKELITVTVNYDASEVVIEPDGSLTAKATVSLGAEYEGIYILTKDYLVNFDLE